jgi:hypothetical protein
LEQYPKAKNKENYFTTQEHRKPIDRICYCQNIKLDILNVISYFIDAAFFKGKGLLKVVSQNDYFLFC